MEDFIKVTEFPGEEVPYEQLLRLCHRYYWAAQFCKDKDIVEVACGSGFGLSYLSNFARSIEAGDYSDEIVEIARGITGSQINILQYDATNMPYEDSSKDVIIIFEAIYYLPKLDKFLNECKRVLKSSGKLLIVTANKDLYDFNPSPFSYSYLGVLELSKSLKAFSFSTKFYGFIDTELVSLRQKILRPLKKIAVRLNLIPNTMDGKRFLKRLVFGKMVTVPGQLGDGTTSYEDPEEISPGSSDHRHKVIYCIAQLNGSEIIRS